MSRLARLTLVALAGVVAGFAVGAEYRTRPYRRPSACPKTGRHPHPSPFPRRSIP
jgi:hypothetical protein